MDVLLKLRVLIWALVICLWGLMVYQYLGEEERDAAQMQRVINPYEGAATTSQPPLPPLETPPDAPATGLRLRDFDDDKEGR